MIGEKQQFFFIFQVSIFSFFYPISLNSVGDTSDRFHWFDGLCQDIKINVRKTYISTKIYGRENSSCSIIFFFVFEICTEEDRHIGNSSERKVVKTVKRRYERWRRKATFCSFLMSSSSSAPFPLLLHFLWELIPGGHIFAHNDVDDDSTSICVCLSFSKPPSPSHQKYFSNDKADEPLSDLLCLTKPRA